MRRCPDVLDTGRRAYPRPPKSECVKQTIAVMELLRSTADDLESARRLVVGAEEITADRRILRALEAIDVLLVNCLIYTEDSQGLSEDITRAVRTLTPDAQITTEWHAATEWRAV